MPNLLTIPKDPTAWANPGRGVDEETIRKWMKGTPGGKRYAGWMGGSKTNVPIYANNPDLLPAEPNGTNQPALILPAFTSSNTSVVAQDTIPAMMSTPEARSVTLPGGEAMPITQGRGGAGWGSEQYARGKFGKIKQHEDNLISTFLGATANRFNAIPESDRRQAMLESALKVKETVGPEPSKVMHPDAHAKWRENIAKTAASAANQAWWMNKERAKGEQNEIETMIKVAAEERLRAEMRLKIATGQREQTKMAWEAQDRNFEPSVRMLPAGEGTVPVLMTSPKSATQARIDPLPTDLPKIGDTKNGLIYTGKVNAQGQPVYEQQAAGGMTINPKDYNYYLTEQTRLQETMKELDKQIAAKKQNKLFNNTSDLEAQKTTITEQLRNIAETLSNTKVGARQGAQQTEQDPLGILGM